VESPLKASELDVMEPNAALSAYIRQRASRLVARPRIRHRSGLPTG
jgi:hypothetical protein